FRRLLPGTWVVLDRSARLHPAGPRRPEPGVERHGLFKVALGPGGDGVGIRRGKFVGGGVDLLRQPVERRKGISVAGQSLQRFMSPGVFDYKFKMKSLAALFDVSMHELCRAGSVGIAHRVGSNGNDM